MRWLLVSSQHHPTHGGIGTYVSRFIAAANAAGWSVDLVTRPSDVHPPAQRIHEIETRDAMSEFAERIPVLRALECIRPYRYALWSCAVAERLLEMKGDFDAVEFVDCQAEGYASLRSPRVRQRFASVPMIVHAHTPMFVEEQINGCDLHRFGRRRYHEWERTALEECDGIIATSQSLANRLPSGPPRKVIPYPINQQDRMTENRADCDQIVFVGSMQPRKGIHVWAESLNQVFDHHPTVKAVAVGPDTLTGPNGVSMISHARTLIDRRHRHQFQWLGAQNHQDVLDVMRKSSVLVAPSSFESFSFVVAEALLEQTPVLVSDCLGICEHVAGIPNCPANDARAWTEAQLRILADPATARMTAAENRAALVQSCSPQRHMAERERFVRSLQAAREPGPSPIRNVDGLTEMSAFIAEVEAAEASAQPVSSVVS